jgi:hypothetical protein
VRHAVTVRAARGLAPAAALLATCAVTRPLAAQSCHLPPPPRSESKQDAASATLRAETAGFSNREYEGHYEGLVPNLTLRRAWFEAAATLPLYRILRNGRSDTGPGDLLLQLRAEALHDAERLRSLGVELAASLPTGNAEHELGMGHVMLMPSAWGTLASGRFGASARLGYAAAVAGSSEHHHHGGGTSPLVDPMNESELDAAAGGSLAITPVLGARVGFYGAVPVATEDGHARAAGFAGLDAQNRRFGSSIELHLPLAGEPFTAKLVLQVGARF